MAINFTGDTFDGDQTAVGIDGVGKLRIGAGSDFLGSEIFVGVYAGSSGVVEVTGAGSLLFTSGTGNFIRIGDAGRGALTVEEGADVETLVMSIGRLGTGTVDVSGEGSSVVCSNDHGSFAGTDASFAGFVEVGAGAGSSGVLRIRGGADFTIRGSTTEHTPQMELGGLRGANGTVEVIGPGSVLNLQQSAAIADPDAVGPRLFVGRAGEGRLTASNGAQINLTGEDAAIFVSLGDQENPFPPVEHSALRIVSGADVTLRSVGFAYGCGVTIGSLRGADGSLMVSGAGSSLSLTSDIADNSPDGANVGVNVGSRGKGSLTVEQGATVRIDGTDDWGPSLIVGRRLGGYGFVTVESGGSIDIRSTNPLPGGEGLIIVGGEAGSHGSLKIASGGSVVNRAGSTNSVMLVGDQGARGDALAARGRVTVTGDGQSETLLDAGALLVIGGSWDRQGVDPANVGLGGSGNGEVLVNNGAIVRADEIVVAIGGEIGGNATFAGDVTIAGGVIETDPFRFRQLAITGDLHVIGGTIEFKALGLRPGVSHDQIVVDGDVVLEDWSLELVGSFGANLEGRSIVVVDATGELTLEGFGRPAGIVADIGSELIVVVPDRSADGLRSILDFGREPIFGGVVASVADGMARGGRFEVVKFVLDNGEIHLTDAADFVRIGFVNVTAPTHLFGRAGDDSLTAGNWSDLVNGGAGADHLDGGADVDSLSYAGSPAGVIVDLRRKFTFGGDAQGDEIVRFENIAGSAKGDALTGDGGGNAIDGSAGNDTLTGGAGADSLKGGIGIDVLSYAASAQAVAVDLSTGATSGGDAAGDSLSGFERIVGSNHADSLTGNAAANSFIGAKGADTITGGNGVDTADYSGGGAVSINLTTGSFLLAAEGDRLTGIERIIGSALGADLIVGAAGKDFLSGVSGNDRLDGVGGADVLAGGGGSDRLVGRAGADALNGNAGNDGITGGSGNDRMTGGEGADIFIFDIADFGRDQITDFTDGADSLRFSRGVADAFADFAIAGNGTADVRVSVIGNAGHSIALHGTAPITLTPADFVLFG